VAIHENVFLFRLERAEFGDNVSVHPMCYLEATGGLGFITEIDVVLAAPSSNLTERATDFYDRTAAVSFGGNAGVLWQVSSHVGAYGQIGLKWMSGLSAIDDLAGTGLETINDDSSRWTIPVVVGMRVRF